MKNYIYTLLIAFFAIALIGCTKDEGTEPGTDGTPKVTVYQYAAPSGYNADQTVNLRVVPNGKVDQIYVYAELKTAKDEYLKTNSEASYAQKVIEKGTKYEAKDQDVIIENLPGKYAISVVAVSGNTNSMVESIFNGIVWVAAGKATIVKETLTGSLTGDVALERQESANIFRVKDLYNQLNSSLPAKGWYVKFTFNDAKKLADFSSTGGKYVWCGYTTSEGVYHGIWDPVNYGTYCKVANGTNIYQVQLLRLNTTTGGLSTAAITFTMGSAVWYTAK